MTAVFKFDQLRNTDVLQRLLIVNVAVFLVYILTQSISGLFMVQINEPSISVWIALPASLPKLLTHPWTLLTYMFYHFSFWHILFNMLWLYWMGRILLEYLGEKKLFSTYIFGGLCGAILFVAAYNVFPLFQRSLGGAYALGASASVLAITVAAATLLPDYKISLFGIFTVPLKYIAIFSILLDLANVSGSNAGGHIAHLGGALFGFIYIRQLKKGRDLAKGFNSMIDNLVSSFSGRPKMRVHHSRARSDEDYNLNKKAKQERVDIILDKISRSGYGSLTQEEKDFLFKSSKE